MDGGAWWAAVYGVAQSQTRLKQLNRSSVQLFFRPCGPLRELGRDTVRTLAVHRSPAVCVHACPVMSDSL